MKRTTLKSATLLLIAALLSLTLGSHDADAGLFRRGRPAQAYRYPARTCAGGHCQAQAQAIAPAPAPGDPGGFLAWLNATRARSGLGPMAYDPALAAVAARNNAAQRARGLGHFTGSGWQNAAQGGGNPGPMWMGDSAHRGPMLSPGLTRIGIAFDGLYWTANFG